MIRKGDTLITPGFGLMDGDFHHHVDKIGIRRIHVSAGMLSGWWWRCDFVKTGDREWTYRSLVKENHVRSQQSSKAGRESVDDVAQ